MKDNKIAEAYESIRPNHYAKQRVRSKLAEPQRRKKRRVIPAFATMTAVLVLLVFAHSILPIQLVNTFSIRAYAMDIQADGTIVRREIDLANQGEVWGGFHYGQHLYININLEVEGENIDKVLFSLENGFFATQYYDPQAEQNNSYRTLHVGDVDNNLRPAVFGTEFERLGSQIALHDVQADNLLLFVVISATEVYSTPESIKIQAQVMFHNGEVQTETFTLNFSGIGVIIGDLPIMNLPEHSDFSSIDFNDLMLITESITTLASYEDTHNIWGGAEMYVWRFENGSTLFANRADFEDTDVKVFGMAHIGEEIRLAVIKLVDGDLVGMEYLVPAEIAKEFGF